MGLIMKKNHDDTIRFSVSLPEGLLQELDSRVVGKGYASRSELIRDLIREKMVEDRWRSGTGRVVGVLTIGYDHHQRDLLRRIVEVQHSRYVNILCSTHVHLDHHHCLEAIIIQGRPSEIERIRAQLGGLRGVKFAKLSKVSKLEL
jgi:CopG family nickel-responsive transcriptional regulator